MVQSRKLTKKPVIENRQAKFNYELVDRIVNISGSFEIEGFDNKELLIQILKSGEIFKGEKRLNDKKGMAHKIKVKIEKIF